MPKRSYEVKLHIVAFTSSIYADTCIYAYFIIFVYIINTCVIMEKGKHKKATSQAIFKCAERSVFIAETYIKLTDSNYCHSIIECE
jgi:hypothetical protein